MAHEMKNPALNKREMNKNNPCFPLNGVVGIWPPLSITDFHCISTLCLSLLIEKKKGIITSSQHLTHCRRKQIWLPGTST